MISPTPTNLVKFATLGLEIYELDITVSYIRIWYVVMNKPNAEFIDIVTGGGWMYTREEPTLRIPFTEDNFWEVMRLLRAQYLSITNRWNVGGVTKPKPTM